MEIRQLEYFVAVADEGHVTRAAARLYVAQSTVSAGIATLERELGIALFERRGRGIAVSDAGEVVLPMARRLLDDAEALRQAATGEVRGRLRVGIFANLEALDLAATLAAFRDRFPLVDLQLGASATGSTGLADDVRHGRVDLAFMGLPAGELDGLASTDLFTVPIVALLPAGHPLAAGAVPTEALADADFVDTPRGFGNRIVVDRALAARGIVRRVRTEAAAIGDVSAFVAGGFGIALLPAALTSPTPGVVEAPLADPIEWTMRVVTRPQPSAATAALRDLIAERYLTRTPRRAAPAARA